MNDTTNRLRTRSVATSSQASWDDTVHDGPTHVNEWFHDRKIGPGKGVHFKAHPSRVVLHYADHPYYHPAHYSWTNFGVLTPTDLYSICRSFITQAELNWKKLNTSSEYGLIQAFAEFDDTLALFTTRFWKQLSYGSLTWGVLPFVSEVKALVAQGKSLLERLENAAQDYEDEFKKTFTGQANHISYTTGGSSAPTEITYEYDLEVTHRLTGMTNLPHDSNAILELLDRAGFHPDALTAWDLVPLSFAVDWFLPIGDWLEAASDRGWIKSVIFTGWYTVKVEGTINYVSRNQPSNVSGMMTGSHKVEYFYREFRKFTHLADGLDELPAVSLKTPSLKNVGNSFYLFLGRGSKK
jgi:hypothetical protein